MMSTPDLWPLGRVLALTRDIAPDTYMPPADVLCFDTISFPRREMGVMIFGGELPRWRIYRLNIYDKRFKALLASDVLDDDTVTTYDYKGAEGAFSDGWRVD